MKAFARVASLLFVVVCLTLPSRTEAQEGLLHNEDGGVVLLWRSEFAARDGTRLIRALQMDLVDRNAIACLVDEGTMAVRLEGGRNMMRVKVISGPRRGCEGYTTAGFGRPAAGATPEQIKGVVRGSFVALRTDLEILLAQAWLGIDRLREGKPEAATTEASALRAQLATFRLRHAGAIGTEGWLEPTLEPIDRAATAIGAAASALERQRAIEVYLPHATATARGDALRTRNLEATRQEHETAKRQRDAQTTAAQHAIEEAQTRRTKTP